MHATITQDARVLHVEINERCDFALAVRGVEGFGAALHRVTHAVRACVPAPRPQRVQRDRFAGARVGLQRLRHHGVAAPNTRESARLRETPELDCAIARAVDLEDGLRRTASVVAFVRGIPEQNGAVLERVRNPRFHARAVHHGASWIVRRAEIDDVGRGLTRGIARTRHIGEEAIRFGTGQVGDAFVATARDGGTCITKHHIRIDIRRVHRIGDGDAISRAKDFEDVAAVAFRAVGEEDFVIRDVDATRAEVALGDRGAHRFVSRTRTVALEGRTVCEFFVRRVHGTNHTRRQWLGHVTDAAADDLFGEFGLLGRERRHATRDLGEKVSSGEFEIVFVDVCHDGSRVVNVRRIHTLGDEIVRLRRACG